MTPQLRQTQGMESLGKMAGGIAHEFNNILTGIIGYGYLLQMEIGNGDPSGTFVQRILESAERAAQLTKGLLMISAKQINNPQPVNLKEFIKRTGVFLLKFTDGKNIRFRTIRADKDGVIMVDREQMDQVFIHLATNAMDAMPGGGSLIISADVVTLNDEFVKAYGYGTAGMYALITFSDTGMGVDEKIKERIFEPFFTTKEVGKGKGLGLSIVYGVVKQHRGYIDFFSETGKGATFRIYLPIQ